MAGKSAPRRGVIRGRLIGTPSPGAYREHGVKSASPTDRDHRFEVEVRMNLRRALHGRLSAVASAVLVSLATLAGCSGQPQEIVGPSRQSPERLDSSRPAEIQVRPPLIERWEAPRITITTDGWRRTQKEGGVSLEPSRIYDLTIPEQQPVTFQWSARPKTGQARILAYRWALDIEDIVDETPRLDDNDLGHWSRWSLSERSATVGPFSAGPDPAATHFFYVEAHDELGFVSLVTVRMRAEEASVGGAEEFPLTRL